MVSRLNGSLTFLAARMSFCLGVSGSGVAVSRKRTKASMLGLQLITLSAFVEESGRHSVLLPKTLGRAAGGTRIPPGAGGLTGGNPGRLLLLRCPRWKIPTTDRLPGLISPGAGSCSGSGAGATGCGASGRVCCCPKRSGRTSRMAANSRARLRTLLFIINCPDAGKAALDYSRRSFCMIGNLRIMLGRNSSTRLPPASVAMDDAKVSPTTLAVTLGSG